MEWFSAKILFWTRDLLQSYSTTVLFLDIETLNAFLIGLRMKSSKPRYGRRSKLTVHKAWISCHEIEHSSKLVGLSSFRQKTVNRSPRPCFKRERPFSSHRLLSPFGPPNFLVFPCDTNIQPNKKLKAGRTSREFDCKILITTLFMIIMWWYSGNEPNFHQIVTSSMMITAKQLW